ncbi:MAG: glycosyltransferase [Vicinamibacterales bacterium]|nr:glycosyltransferase [Vicinamibacterales bacterium]
MTIRTVGVFCDHTSGVGGGEHYAFSLLRALLARYPVDLIVRDEAFAPDPVLFQQRFGIDLRHPRLRVRVLESPHEIRRYDLFINLSHFTILPPWARRNLLVVFFPEARSEWVAQYDAVLTISRFSASFIERYWGATHHVIAAPPVEAARFAPAPKEHLIVSVGRYFDVPDGNNKNHLLMIQALAELHARGHEGWRLVLAGSTSEAHAGYLARVREAAAGLPVDVWTDVSFDALRDLYARASIYWHAAGFHRDGLTLVPAAAEHFGITIVEAMAAGAVPVIADAGGAAEIVEEPAGGLKAATLDQFVEKTAWLIGHPDDRARMSVQAVARAGGFSHARFTRRVHDVIDMVCEADPASQARFFLADGNLARAEARLLEAIDRHPVSGDAHFDLADCWFRLGRREPALAMWRRAVELDPGHPRAARALALATRIDAQRQAVARVRSGALFGEDYFEHGRETGLNDYADYTDSFAGVQAGIVAATFQPGSCLEIGCARGEFVRELRQRGVRAFGTDISVYSVASAEAHTRGHLTASAIAALPYADNAFDLVTAVEVFEHVPPEQVDTAIRELWRVARTFVWVTVQNTDAATPEHFFTDLTHVTMKPLAWWQDRFRANGFEVLPFELPFGQFRQHQILAQPLGKHAHVSAAALAAHARALEARGDTAGLANFVDLLAQEGRTVDLAMSGAVARGDVDRAGQAVR